MTISDLQVEPISSALAGKSIDVIISGSIGAVEAPKFLRALRRLGAKTIPWLTDGGSQFITETALAWAADHPVRRGFSGTDSHLATADACVVAPASANFINGLTTGQTNTAALAVAASHLGSGNKLLVLPNMHDSLANAPGVKRNTDALKTLGQDGCHILAARTEEGKQKFPPPEILAGEVAQTVNQRTTDNHVVVTMGTTRGYIDDVRYLSNYSSGALGTAIAEELYYHGFSTQIVCGPCPITPRFMTHLLPVQTTEEMLATVNEMVTAETYAAIFAASVLDYAPVDRQKGKIRSSAQELTITCVPTPKIIGTVSGANLIKIGFKLEPQLDEQKAVAICKTYKERYQLKYMVLNALGDVSPTSHRAMIINCETFAIKSVEGKINIARSLVNFLLS